MEVQEEKKEDPRRKNPTLNLFTGLNAIQTKSGPIQLAPTATATWTSNAWNDKNNLYDLEM